MAEENGHFIMKTFTRFSPGRNITHLMPNKTARWAGTGHNFLIVAQKPAVFMGLELGYFVDRNRPVFLFLDIINGQLLPNNCPL